MKYFTMNECCRSDIAAAKGMDNTPRMEHRLNIEDAVDNLLDPLREEWGKVCERQDLGSPSLIISSGYRSDEVNKYVGGSDTSAHRYGLAFDVVPGNGKMREFKDFCVRFLKDRNFDQLISENEDKNGVPRWMHIGYKHPSKGQRRQMLKMVNKKYFLL